MSKKRKKKSSNQTGRSHKASDCGRNIYDRSCEFDTSSERVRGASLSLKNIIAHLI